MLHDSWWPSERRFFTAESRDGEESESSGRLLASDDPCVGNPPAGKGLVVECAKFGLDPTRDAVLGYAARSGEGAE